jgi:hypothetical protein
VEKHPLAVRVLEVTEYPPAGQGHSAVVYQLPTWQQIEAAVRALDHPKKQKMPHE